MLRQYDYRAAYPGTWFRRAGMFAAMLFAPNEGQEPPPIARRSCPVRTTRKWGLPSQSTMTCK